jgi:hypothetical protein
MAPLESLLKYLNSGYSGQAADQSVLDAFGGDALLEAARKYDPEARWQDVTTGENNSGRSLVVDIEKLPKSKMGKAGFDLRATNFMPHMKNPNAVEHSDVYGDVTNSGNLYDDADPLWTKYAPLLVTFAAPMIGSALAAAGIGGAAGLTAGVTGSGLAAGAVPKWATMFTKGLPSNARSISEGNFDLTKLLPFAAQFAGINPSIASAGSTLAQLARRGR